MKRLVRRRLPAVLPSGRPSTAPAPPTSRFIVKATLISPRAESEWTLRARTRSKVSIKSFHSRRRRASELLGWSIFSLSLARFCPAPKAKSGSRIQKDLRGSECVVPRDARPCVVFAFIFCDRHGFVINHFCCVSAADTTHASAGKKC